MGYFTGKLTLHVISLDLLNSCPPLNHSSVSDQRAESIEEVPDPISWLSIDF